MSSARKSLLHHYFKNKHFAHRDQLSFHTENLCGNRWLAFKQKALRNKKKSFRCETPTTFGSYMFSLLQNLMSVGLMLTGLRVSQILAAWISMKRQHNVCLAIGDIVPGSKETNSLTIKYRKIGGKACKKAKRIKTQEIKDSSIKRNGQRQR